MTMPLKIAVIGGGSTYTPELIDGLLRCAVPIREIALVDPNATRLNIVGGLAQRMATGSGMVVSQATERSAALDGADVVVTQIRVGGMAARILDERIPQRFGLIGQETTGPGGFANALRTIPVILAINREMAVRCPDAWLINFTNPSGLISEALLRHGRGKIVGLCNYPLTLKMHVAEALGVDETQVTLPYFGLNHLSWTRILVDGVDRTDEVLALMTSDTKWRELSGFAFNSRLLRRLGLIPSGYLRYYYEAKKMVREQRTAPQTRGERVQEVESRLLAQYADPHVQKKPAELQERGGAWYSTVAVRLIQDLWSAEGGTQILNVTNAGAIPTLPEDSIVEVPARVAHGALTSLPTVTMRNAQPFIAGHRIPPDVEILMTQVKIYERATVAAAISGSHELACAALRAHPLLETKQCVAPALLEELLSAHKEYLPLFFE